jgi:sialate O-acetylesterase
MKKLLTLLASLALSLPAIRADVVLSSIISNGMVLQRGVKAPVWGWADAGEEVTVEFGGQVKKAIPGPDRKWMVDLDPLEASATPRSMSISGKNKILLENILVGEVWIAAGQSNMDWTFHQIDPAEREFAESQKENSLIRAFHVHKNLKAGIPMDDTPGVWKDAAQMVAGPNSVSAVGFFFALELAKSLGIPVAILDVNWGGQKIEPFLAPEGYQAVGLPLPASERRMSRSAQEAANHIASAKASVDESYQAAQKGLKMAFNVSNPYGDAENFIYNAMVAPLAPYAVQGTIWYQGESNRGAQDYLKKLQALSAGWSQVFRVKDIPLLMVQIAPYDYSKGKDLSLSLLGDRIWAAQYKAADTISGVTVVPIHDTNIDIQDVHPIYKRTVGERLAASALKNQYQKEGVVASAPRFQSATREGSKVVVSFSGILNGLTTTDGKAPSWFELSSDGVSFVPAQAELQGNTVLVSAEAIPEPKFVRMGWRDIAIPNLKDKDAWPVYAFPAQPVAQPAISQTPIAPKPMIVAHRGSSAQAPENTLPSFQLAWEQGADAIEGDFQLTKDGHVICFHDKDTKRIAGQPLTIANATLEELRQLDVGSIQPEASERALHAWSADKFQGTRMPTIAEVFATVPAGKKMFIEIKCGPEIIDPLLRELGSSGLTPEQVVVIGFDSALLKSLKERDPKWQTAWLCSFEKRANGKPQNAPAKILKTLKEMNALALMSGLGDVDKGLLDQIRAAGIEHYVWTINDPKLGPAYKAQGVDAIITDLPAEMRTALNSSAKP